MKKKVLNLPKTSRVELPAPFINSSGSIQNLIEHDCGGVQIITSIRGTIRANHSHADWHYLYVISGRAHYFERPAGSTDMPVDGIMLAPGNMVFTPPGVEHAVWFSEESVVLSISGGHRTHAEHEASVKRLNCSLVPNAYIQQWRR